MRGIFDDVARGLEVGKDLFTENGCCSLVFSSQLPFDGYPRHVVLTVTGEESQVKEVIFWGAVIPGSGAQGASRHFSRTMHVTVDICTFVEGSSWGERRRLSKLN